jgi:hypothetical protein
MNLQDERAHDLAVCCFLSLCRPAQTEPILNVLPEAKQRAMRELLAQVSGLPQTELAGRLGKLRQKEFAEAIGRRGVTENESWESMLPPLLRWLCACELEANGRKDHQGEDRH